MELLRNKSAGAGSLCALALALAFTACASTSAPDGFGTVTLDLAGQSTSGVTYRLRHAAITVAGDAYMRTWNTDDNPDQSSLSDEVPAGDYAATLAEGWNLERVDGGVASPVAASLESPNPAAFSVTAASRTSVAFRFQVGQDAFVTGGGYDITIGIDEPPPGPEIIVACNQNSSTSPPSRIVTFPAAASGDAVPSELISGSSARITTPNGVAVAGDQILVADTTTGIVSFFSRFATGNASPIKQISTLSSTTGVFGADHVAVAGTEFYVAGRRGIGVFPLTVTTATVPTRVVASSPTIDLVVRDMVLDAGQVYLSFQSTNENDIRVYSATAGGLASNPVRVIFSATPGFCPGAMTVVGSELFVVDNCNGNIAVFPKTGNGTLLPVRVIRPVGATAGLLATFAGSLYVASTDKIAVLPASASGDFTPVRTISGADTRIGSMTSLLVH